MLRKHLLLSLDSIECQSITDHQPSKSDQESRDGEGHEGLDDGCPVTLVGEREDVGDSCEHKSCVGGVEEVLIRSVLDQAMVWADCERVLLFEGR